MGKSRKTDSIIFIICFVITIGIIFAASYLFYTSFTEGEEVSIIYQEESNLNYRVLLKENDFYSDEYLTEDYNIIASAIDEIEISFDYLLTTSKKVTGKSYYTIDSKIVATQKSDDTNRKVWDYNKQISDKAITLFDEEVTKMPLSDKFEIKYEKYKKMMEEYQKKYAVLLDGNLIIEIGIKSDFKYERFNNITDLTANKLTLTIPLTESIIKIDKTIPQKTEQLLIEKKDAEINYIKLVGSIIDLILSFFMTIFLARTLVKIFGVDSKYEKQLNKILKTYNYLIVNVKDLDLKKEKKILYVESFEDLLDAQSELRVPILYHNVKPKKEDIFVVKYEQDILVYKMESRLYEDNSKKVKKNETK